MQLTRGKDQSILALDASNIAAYTTCPRLWDYKYVKNIRSVRPKKALDLGTFTHYLLELYYLNPTKLREMLAIILDVQKEGTIKKLVDEFGELPHNYQPGPEDPKFPAVDLTKEEFLLVIQRMVHYTAFYSSRDLKPVTFNLPNGGQKIGTEIGFSQPIDTPIIDGHQWIYTVEGRMDLLVETPLGIAWVDHKTQGRKSELYGHKIQFRTYDLALNGNSGARGHGMVNYFGLQKSYTEGDTFRRNLITFTAESRDEFRNYLVKDVFDKVRRMVVEPNFGMCAGAYESNPCDFARVCENASELGREALLKQEFIAIQPWRPW